MAEKNVMHLMKRIILDENIKDWLDVGIHHRTELTVMLLDFYGCEGLEFIVDEPTVASKLIKYMLNPETCYALDLAAEVESVTLERYDAHLCNIFNAELSKIQVEGFINSGLKAHTDTNTGETVWL